MVLSSSRCFSAAVERIIRNHPHGFQKDLAKRIKISPQYLNDLVAGRKLWPDEHKDRVAHQLGASVSELLQIGQVLVETGQFFPYLKDVAALHPQSENRAEWVMQRAGRDEGIGGLRLHDLRHTYAAMYLEAGGDLFALKELLGHRQIQTTMIYAHLSKEKLQQEADRVTFA